MLIVIHSNQMLSFSELHREAQTCKVEMLGFLKHALIVVILLVQMYVT